MAAALVVALAACSGGGDGDDRDASPRPTDEEPTDEATAGDAPAASAEELFAGGYLASAELGNSNFTVTYEATVAAPDRYRATFGGFGAGGEYRRIGDDVYTRSGSDADGGLFEVAPVDESTSRGILVTLAEHPDDAEFVDDGIVATLLLEALILDPASVLDPSSVPPGRAEVEVELPDEVAAALAALDIDIPDHEVVTHRSGKRVHAIDLRFDLEEFGTVEGGVRYGSWGQVDPAEIVPPPPEEIDPTPSLDEEALAAFTDAPLLAPATVPEGLQLTRAVVLSPEETVESCQQVQLEYLDVADPSSGRELTLFLLPAACATEYDPGPFDEVVGGRPARGGGYEVLVDATVVQVVPSDGVTAEEIDAMVASLAPVTAADLIAAVSTE